MPLQVTTVSRRVKDRYREATYDRGELRRIGTYLRLLNVVNMGHNDRLSAGVETSGYPFWRAGRDHNRWRDSGSCQHLPHQLPFANGIPNIQTSNRNVLHRFKTHGHVLQVHQHSRIPSPLGDQGHFRGEGYPESERVCQLVLKHQLLDQIWAAYFAGQGSLIDGSIRRHDCCVVLRVKGRP